ncbi:MAG: YbhB/YbcL family Raf kinase inhibitor-like protein [Acidimicrobiales bacterium]
MAGLHLGDLQITSPAFGHGERIPDRHTTNGDDVSPELSWTGAPDGTRAFALVCHDPDAPLTDGFTHWVVAGIPGDATSIPEGGGAAFTQGTTDFGAEQYNGPAPPPGHGTHHYFFHLYALSDEVEVPAGISRAELLERIDSSILVQARLVGTYDR